jgi:hypothetical protein
MSLLTSKGSLCAVSPGQRCCAGRSGTREARPPVCRPPKSQQSSIFPSSGGNRNRSSEAIEEAARRSYHLGRVRSPTVRHPAQAPQSLERFQGSAGVERSDGCATKHPTVASHCNEGGRIIRHAKFNSSPGGPSMRRGHRGREHHRPVGGAAANSIRSKRASRGRFHSFRFR